MIKVINNIPKLVLLVYMVIKVWEILPITIKEDLPELILSNIVYGLISLNLLYFTYWVWICPMDRIRGVKTIKDLCLIKHPCNYRLKKSVTATLDPGVSKQLQ